MRIRMILFSVCLMYTSVCFALPTPIQTKTASATSANPAATLTTAANSGNLLFVVGSNRGSAGVSPVSPTSVSDNKGNTWTNIDTFVTSNGVQYTSGYSYYSENIVSGTTTITINGLTSSTESVMVVAEYPIKGTGLLDVHIKASAVSTSAASGSTASPISQYGSLVVGWVATGVINTPANPTSPNPSSDQTNIFGTWQGATLSDGMSSSAGTKSASYTVSGSNVEWVCGVATFKVNSTNFFFTY